MCDTMGPMTVDPFEDSSDFARLYGGTDSPLSPRMASQLWTTAIHFADTYADSDVTDLPGGRANALPTMPAAR